MVRAGTWATSRRCALLHIKDKIKYTGCGPEAYEMQQFVIERQGVGKVCEAEESQDQHDDESEKNKPLPKTNLASERA